MSRPTDEELKRLGATLREIDPSSLAADPEGSVVRWFLGGEGTEIYVWTHPSSPPHHVQLVFARVSVEWSNKRGLVTGTFRDAPTTSGGRYDSYILMVGAQVDPEVCEAALVLLESSTVDRSAIGPLLDVLRQGPGTPPGG
jgi:hypothetical protein